MLLSLTTAHRGLYDQAQLIQPAQLMIEKIDKYLRDAVKKPVYIVSMILDPRFKTMFWKTHEEFILDHYNLLVDEIIQTFKAIAQDFYNIMAKNQEKDTSADKSSATSATKPHSFFASALYQAPPRHQWHSIRDQTILKGRYQTGRH